MMMTMMMMPIHFGLQAVMSEITATPHLSSSVLCSSFKCGFSIEVIYILSSSWMSHLSQRTKFKSSSIIPFNGRLRFYSRQLV